MESGIKLFEEITISMKDGMPVFATNFADDPTVKFWDDIMLYSKCVLTEWIEGTADDIDVKAAGLDNIV